MIDISEAVTLTARERATVASIVTRFADRIGPVRVFGSRANGRARPGSDLDLAFYPPFSQRDLYDLMEEFEQSDLPITVDLIDMQTLSSDPLRQQIERYAIPLFEPSDAET